MEQSDAKTGTRSRGVVKLAQLTPKEEDDDEEEGQMVLAGWVCKRRMCSMLIDFLDVKSLIEQGEG